MSFVAIKRMGFSIKISPISSIVYNEQFQGKLGYELCIIKVAVKCALKNFYEIAD